MSQTNQKNYHDNSRELGQSNYEASPERKTQNKTFNDKRKDFKSELEQAKRYLLDGNSAVIETIYSESSFSSISSIDTYESKEGKINKAEGSLIGASYALIKYKSDVKKAQEEGNRQDNEREEKLSEEEIKSYTSDLHRASAKMYLAQKDFTKAIDEMKAYVSRVSYSRFILILKVMEHKFIDIWYKYLKEILSDEEGSNYKMDEITLKEAFNYMKDIQGCSLFHLEFLSELSEFQNPFSNKNIIKARFSLAFLFRLMNDVEGYKEELEATKELIIQILGEDNKKIERIQEMIDYI